MNIPTGIPLIYKLDDDLKPINHYYLGDPEAVKQAIEAVENQGRAKYGKLLRSYLTNLLTFLFYP